MVSSSSISVFKFNVDGVGKRKSDLGGIGSFLCNNKEKHVGLK